MSRHFRSPMRPRRHPAIGYSPAELTPAITGFGRNLLRLLHGRGELHPQFLARLFLHGPIDVDGRPRSRRSVPLDELGAAPDKATLKRLRAVASTPPELPALGDTYFARNFAWLTAELLLLELAEEMNSRKHEKARRIGFFETRVTGPGRADEGWGLANVSRE